MSDDIPGMDIGEMGNLTLYELDDGTQVLRIGGEDGEACVPIPENMAVAFAETARRVVQAYDLEAYDTGTPVPDTLLDDRGDD